MTQGQKPGDRLRPRIFCGPTFRSGLSLQAARSIRKAPAQTPFSSPYCLMLCRLRYPCYIPATMKSGFPVVPRCSIQLAKSSRQPEKKAKSFIPHTYRHRSFQSLPFLWNYNNGSALNFAGGARRAVPGVNQPISFRLIRTQAHARNSFLSHTYEFCAGKSFRSHTYEKMAGGPLCLPFLPTPSPLRSRRGSLYTHPASASAFGGILHERSFDKR